VTDESPETSGAGDAAREALAAAKAAAMDKVRDANRVRREAEASGAAARRAEGRRVRREPGDRRDWDHPRAFGDAISELMSMRGWEGDVAVARVLAEWPQVVGEEIASHASPVSFVDGVLTLQAESTAWATQLRIYLAAELIAKLNERFGDGVVTAIQARGPAGPPRAPGSLRMRDSRGPRDTYG
jgi:predicted nucleic acid-binding Zn ribbon protein